MIYNKCLEPYQYSSVGVVDRYVEQALLKEVRKEVHCCPMSLCWQNSVTDQLNDPMNNRKIGGALLDGERETAGQETLITKREGWHEIDNDPVANFTSQLRH